MSAIYPIGALPAQLVIREEDLSEAENLLKNSY
jgi:hypothetical protein